MSPVLVMFRSRPRSLVNQGWVRPGAVRVDVRFLLGFFVMMQFMINSQFCGLGHSTCAWCELCLLERECTRAPGTRIREP